MAAGLKRTVMDREFRRLVVARPTISMGKELGFLPGEPLQLLRRGPGGREPLAVLIGETMFGLRLLEAQCIEVELG